MTDLVTQAVAPDIPMASDAEGDFRERPLLPALKANSVRRTTSIEVSWPEGRMRPAVFDCRARDIRIGDLADRQDIFGWAECSVIVSAAREIIGLITAPVDPRAVQMIGVVAGKRSRSAIREVFGEKQAISSPLCALLDDLAGVSLVAPWAWFVARTLYAGGEREAATGAADLKQPTDELEQPAHEVCLGYSKSSRNERIATGEGNYPLGRTARVLTLPGDLDALHQLPDQPGVTMRRVRWLDIHRQDGKLFVDIGVQDSASAPDLRQRRTVHQYTGRVIVQNGSLIEISISPEILPYNACFRSPENIPLLHAIPISELSTLVPKVLKTTLGCTHLNDMLRTLSSIPALARRIEV